MRRTSFVMGGMWLALVVWSLGCATSDTDRRLADAVKRGDVDAARTLLAQGGNVNARDQHGFPLYWEACTWFALLEEARPPASRDMFDLLLSQGANANAKDRDLGWTLLHWAAAQDHQDIAELALAHGASINVKTNWGETPLHLALWGAVFYARERFVEEIGGPAARTVCLNRPGWTLRTNGDELVKCLIEAGADANAREKRKGYRPMHYAAFAISPVLVARLIAAGADVNAADVSGATPLHALLDEATQMDADISIAARQGHQPEGRGWPGASSPSFEKDVVEVLRLLIANGANVCAKDHDGRTPLHLAACSGRVSLTEPLVAAGADVAAVNKAGDTPLHMAAQSGEAELVSYLIEHGAAVNARDRSGYTPLYVAARRNLKAGGGDSKAVVEALLAQGADPGIRTRGGETALGAALLAGQEDVAALLRSRSAPADIVGASAAGDLDTVAALLSADPRLVKARDTEGATALIRAAEKGHASVVELLLAKKADVSATMDQGLTALHLAAYEGHADIVRLLLSARANVNARDKQYHGTALHAAAWQNHEEVAEVLLAYGADVNAKALEGMTPLLVTLMLGDGSLAKLLVTHGANPNVVSPEGRSTPLLLAAENGNWDLVRLLVERGANVNAKDELGGSALSRALGADDNAGIIRLLATKGADVNQKDDNGDTPLHRAVRQGSAEVVEILLAHGAKVNVKDDNGRTPLLDAQTEGLTDVVALLRKHGGKL